MINLKLVTPLNYQEFLIFSY